MHTLVIRSPKIATQALLQAFVGSLFIALCALVRIPTIPVPTTLQTFAIVILALSQTPKIAFLSLIFYLAEATMGLPVLSGGRVDPLWFISPVGGYLFTFPVAAYVISSLANKHSSFLRKFSAALCGDSLIYLFGFLQLSHFVGASTALLCGVLCFIPFGILKILLAIGFLKTRSIWFDRKNPL